MTTLPGKTRTVEWKPGATQTTRRSTGRQSTPAGDLIIVPFRTQQKHKSQELHSEILGLTSRAPGGSGLRGTSSQEGPWRMPGVFSGGAVELRGRDQTRENEDRGKTHAAVGNRGRSWGRFWQGQVTGRRTGAGGRVWPRSRLWGRKS